METGTCCWPAPPHICNRNAPSSHNWPWETKSFDLQILRGPLHAEPKIKYMFAGLGSSRGAVGRLGREKDVGGGHGIIALYQCFKGVSLVFLLSCVDSEK